MITLVRLKCLKSSPLVIYDALGLFFKLACIIHGVPLGQLEPSHFRDVRTASAKLQRRRAKVRRCDGEVKILISLGFLKLYVTTYMNMYRIYSKKGKSVSFRENRI